MRPNFAILFLWAGWLGAFAAAQAPDGRPSNFRDAGVIQRATPPGPLNSPAPTRGSVSDFPQAPTNASAQSSAVQPAALSDRAWTSAPAPNQVSPTQQFNQPSQNGVARAGGRLSDASGTQPVVPAQYVANQNSGSASTGVTANNKSHEPRPLKPPSHASTSDAPRGSTGTVQMFVSVFSSLAIVIGLIFGSAWFYRKAAPKINGALPKQVVQVLGRTPLAPRQQLILLRLGSKLVLVSNLQGEVRTISEITDPLEVDRLSGLCEAAQPGSISDSFRSVLHNIGRNE